MVRPTSWMIALGCLGACGSGCGSDGGSGEFLRPPADPTFGSSSSTTTTTTTTDSGDTNDTDQAACSAEAPCAEGLFCVADSIGGGVVGHEPYACSETCVGSDDPSRWCLDDAACCDGLPCNNGLCGAAVDTTPTSTDASSGESGQGSSGETTGTGTDDTSGAGSTGGSGSGSTGDTGQ